MTEHSQRGAPNRRREESTELGTTFSWLFGLLPNAHGAGSGKCRCHADFSDCIRAHSSPALEIGITPIQFATKPSWRSFRAPRLIAFNPLHSLRQSAVTGGRLEASQICDLLDSKQRVELAGI
jgi:hypothetical protein